MKNMPNTDQQTGSADKVDSPTDAGTESSTDPFATGAEGQSAEKATDEDDDKKAPVTTGEGASKEGEKLTDEERKELDNLRTVTGKSGKELGEYRQAFENLAPLLDKLEGEDDIVKAILEGKIDKDLAKSVLEGKADLETAEQVAKAKEKVEEEAKKQGEKLSADEIVKKVTEELKGVVDAKIGEAQERFQQSISSVESKREFENSIKEFVAETPDFADYADEIWPWFEDNPGQYDVSVAYEVIRGRRLAAEKEKGEELSVAEKAKEIAANASGGGSQSTNVITDKNVIDELLGTAGDPNAINIPPEALT